MNQGFLCALLPAALAFTFVYSGGSQNMVSGSAAAASLGKLLQVQILSPPHTNLLNQNLQDWDPAICV